MGNTDGGTCSGRSAGKSVSGELDRVRQVAGKDKDARFTALLHHVSVTRLMLAFGDLNPGAAPGTDGVTWQEYEQDLVANLRDLHERVQSGRYRARPSRRVCIPEAGGRQRPPGIASLEDKIVQRAVTGVLNAVCETDFRGFSCGFRPGRSPHQALDALTAGICQEKVSWVLDADIRDFSGSLDRDWLMRFLRHRAKLHQARAEIMRRRHLPVPGQGRWLASVIAGHQDYYAVPGNYQAVNDFRYEVTRHWRHALSRRSQNGRITWDRMHRIAVRWLPRTRITHPFPEQRFAAAHPWQEPSAVIPLAGICAGGRPQGRSLPRPHDVRGVPRRGTVWSLMRCTRSRP